MEHLSVMTAPAPEAPTTALGAGPGFVVELEAFSGPLDLLLHLLREEQLEIADIPIARIADQFLQAIHELGLNQAADYLDMASRLVRLKAQMLLPRRPEEDGWEDPRAELVPRAPTIRLSPHLCPNVSVSACHGIAAHTRVQGNGISPPHHSPLQRR